MKSSFSSLAPKVNVNSQKSPKNKTKQKGKKKSHLIKPWSNNAKALNVVTQRQKNWTEKVSFSDFLMIPLAAHSWNSSPIPAPMNYSFCGAPEMHGLICSNSPDMQGHRSHTVALKPHPWNLLGIPVPKVLCHPVGTFPLVEEILPSPGSSCQGYTTASSQA